MPKPKVFSKSDLLRAMRYTKSVRSNSIKYVTKSSRNSTDNNFPNIITFHQIEI